MRMISRIVVISACAAFLSAPAFALVDINTASESELDTLPGIGPAYAKRIIEFREANGLFRSINEITRVRGIGPKTFEKLRDLITVSGAPETQKKAPAAKEAPPPPQAKAAPPPPEEKPIEVPVYSMESKRMLKCWRCKNVFIVSGDLKSGWCPYCMEKWVAK